MARGRARRLWGPGVIVLASCGAPPPRLRSPAPTATAEPVASATAAPTSVPPPTAPAPLSEAALRAHVEALAAPVLRGRGSGTADEAAAAQRIVDHLEAWGVAPAMAGYLQSFRLRPDSGRQSANVVASLPGAGRLADEVVVFGAHYDHLGVKKGVTYPGAEDNASGVAVVLETARALAEETDGDRREVLFIFFGAEEMGLLGSRHYVRHPVRPLESTVAMVNIDMIGRPLIDQEGLGFLRRLVKLDPDASIGALGTADRPVLRDIVEDACAEQALQLWATEDLPRPIQRFVEAFSDGRGDSFSFEDAGVPALFFGAGESGDYHQPTDTADRLRYPLLARRARAIAEVLRRLRTSPERPKRPR